MDMTPFKTLDNKELEAIESFATYIHNDWGIGKDTSCGGTGVLFALSIQDRAMFLSCGQAIKTVLTDSQLDLILNKVKPFLQQNNYTAAIIQMMKELEHYLTLNQPTNLMDQLSEHKIKVEKPRQQDYCNQWPGDLPTPQEKRNELFAALIFLFIVGAGVILLVVIIIANEKIQQSERQVYAQVQSQLTKLDQQRAQALQGHYENTSCPICLEAFILQSERICGSDGQPLKLLRCGHVFDETCWSTWITSGQANVQRCPICQQDVGSPTNHERDQATDDHHHLRQHPNDIVQEQFHVQGNDSVQQLNREQSFRLARMATRFPRYIRSEQIQEWTSSTFDGSLARDPTFVLADPSRVQTPSTTTSNDGNQQVEKFSFGTSAGGRGSRW